jgi:putative pyruvate formate lyase activating enzyme
MAAPTRKAKSFEPAYVGLERSGELARRARALYLSYRNCRLCPRECCVNRLRGEKGVCLAPAAATVYSAHPHFGEEAPLSGRRGSGTIFFGQCNLRCVFCQNFEIVQPGAGSPVSDTELADLMIGLQRRGCHNINLVTPTHYVPSIVQALRIAVRQGLRIPLVYNCCGYEPVHVLRQLDGIVDIYLPDFKYADPEAACRYSPGARDYPEVAAAAIEEMRRQVGELVLDEDGIALRGLMVRHLVLPGNAAGTDKFVRFVADRLGPETYVNIMSQYRPAYRAFRFPELSRRITDEEYRQALEWARQAGLTRVERQ